MLKYLRNILAKLFHFFRNYDEFAPRNAPNDIPPAP